MTEEEQAKFQVMFIYWYLNKKKGMTQAEIGIKFHKSREDINRYIKKWEKVFQFIEIYLAKAWIDRQEAKNKEKQGENGGRAEKGE